MSTPPDDPNHSIARRWPIKAQHDLLLCARAAEPPLLAEGLTFHAQQAAEKALEGYLAWRGVPFSKTHELRWLAAHCASLDAAFISLADAADALNQYLAAGRYPGEAAEPTPPEAEQAWSNAKQIVAFVLGRLPHDARP